MISSADTTIPDVALAFGKGNSNLVFLNSMKEPVMMRAEILGLPCSVDDNPDNLDEFLLNYNAFSYPPKVVGKIDDFLFAHKRFSSFLERLSETENDPQSREKLIAEIKAAIFGVSV